LAKSRRKAKPNKLQLVRIGHREVETFGLGQGFWTDLYHRSMTVRWPVFFASAALIFIVLNAVFAGLFSLGDHPIANTAGRGFLDLFYFSIETLATVGYKELKKTGVFLVPGFAKFVVIKKPATKARSGTNPFNGEPMTFKAKPARKIVRARPVKAAKDAV